MRSGILACTSSPSSSLPRKSSGFITGGSILTAAALRGIFTRFPEPPDGGPQPFVSLMFYNFILIKLSYTVNQKQRAARLFTLPPAVYNLYAIRCGYIENLLNARTDLIHFLVLYLGSAACFKKLLSLSAFTSIFPDSKSESYS